MGQAHARHFGAWALTFAFELAAGIMSQWQAWTIVTILFWMGIFSLILGYLPDLKTRFQTGKLFAWEFFKLAVVSFVMLCAVYFVTSFSIFVFNDWMTPVPQLFEPEAWAKQNRVFVNESPQQLVEMRDKYTELMAEQMMSKYIGKWYAITGSVDDIYGVSQFRGPPKALTEIHKPSVFLNFRGRKGTLFLQFEDKWDPEIELLNKGDKISAYCKIAAITGFSFNLDHCQIVRR